MPQNNFVLELAESIDSALIARVKDDLNNYILFLENESDIEYTSKA